FGERFATRLIAAYFNKLGLDTQPIDAFKLGLITTSDFGQAHPLPESQPRIARALRRIKKLPIITGFIGKDKSGNITTLGRDGSDYTASFIGAALRAREIQIWRDIDGIMTANPRIVPRARLVKEISLEEAGELARYSSGVFHPYMLTPAIRHQIPIRILNIFKPRSGTTVVNRSALEGIAKSITYKPHINLVNLVSPEMFHHRGMVTKVFDVLGANKIQIDMLASSRISLSLAVANREAKGLKPALKEISKFAQINIAPHKAIVCVIGEGIKKVPGIVAKVFTALDKAKIRIEMISHGATKTNLTLLVNNSQATQAVRVLHKTIFR
ncbi:aspartate kinase, partial [Planctomycetota bacterium]